MVADEWKTGMPMRENPQLDSTVLAYSQKLFSYLLQRCPNKDVAIRVMRELLVEMYRSVQTTHLDNPLEAMLYCRAGDMQDALLAQHFRTEADAVLQQVVQADAASEEASPSAPSVPEVKPIPPLQENPAIQKLVRLSAMSCLEREEVLAAMQAQAALAEDTAPEEACPPAAEELVCSPAVPLAPAVPFEEPTPVEADEPAEKKKGRHLSALAIVLLSLGGLSVAWLIAGLCMVCGFLPKVDLGYQWFSTHIAPWF